MSQRSDALAVANQRRTILKELREHINGMGLVEGCRIVAGVLEDPTEHEAAIPVTRLLMSIDHFGIQSVKAAVKKVGIITADRRVRELTERERRALADVLRLRGGGYHPKLRVPA